MNNLFVIGLCGAVGLAISLGLIPLIRKVSLAKGLVRGAREAHHTHRVPVPRYGGLALVVAFVVVELLAMILSPVPSAQIKDTLAMVITSVAMFVLGFCDDLKPLGAKKKLLAQLGIAATACLFGVTVDTFKVPFADLTITLGWAGYLVTVLWLVAITNLINLVDGVDGLAGGICLMLMALLAYVGAAHSNLHLVAAGMVGALAGFLWFNFPPARIYMGDGGAYFLGYLIGISTLISSQKGTVLAALVAPLFVLALPILDTSLAIVRRGLHGLPIFRPDRRHIHHRLLDSGISPRMAVLGIYAFTAIFLLMGFAAFASKGLWIPNLVGLGTLLILLLAGKLNFSREWFAVGRVLGNSLEMRQEIQYALTLTQWLTLEGGRCNRMDSLWESLVFVARKLGFSFVRLRLDDGERTWQQAGSECDCQTYVAAVLEGQFGKLELGSRLCGTDVITTASEEVLATVVTTEECLTVGDKRSFNMIADLVAEGWVKAARRWLATHQVPLRFDALPSAKVVSLDEATSRYVGGLH